FCILENSWTLGECPPGCNQKIYSKVNNNSFCRSSPRGSFQYRHFGYSSIIPPESIAPKTSPFQAPASPTPDFSIHFQCLPFLLSVEVCQSFPWLRLTPSIPYPH